MQYDKERDTRIEENIFQVKVIFTYDGSLKTILSLLEWIYYKRIETSRSFEFKVFPRLATEWQWA